MIEADRILEPVAPDAAPIRGLREYTSSASLADAMRGSLDAVEQTLRLLLRADRGASEQDRMRAMSAQELPFDQLIERLRGRDRISIQLAGMVHELRRQSITGGATFAPGPADADRALELIARLRHEVREQQDATVRDAVHHTLVEHPLEKRTSAVRPAAPVGRMPTLVGLGTSLFVLAFALFLAWRGLDDPLADGIEAFRGDDLTEAVQHFRDAVAEDEEDATPRLYLGRVYRRLDRFAEAGDQLRRAAAIAPRDADVRRELGYLFIDLRSFDAAVRQLEQAVELEPAEDASWIALVRAMRLAGDPRADETLARAPARARALLTTEPGPASGNDPE